MPKLSIKANPAFDPANFVPGVDNPYMTLQPGTTMVYRNEEADETVNFEVTRETKVIAGVTCVVVHDQSIAEGELSEDTFDYIAQDKFGNVWYFGEDTKELEDGKVVSTEGSWLAGVDGATAGILMEDHPQAGDHYIQENAPGVAEDQAKVITLDALVDAPYGSSMHALETDEFTPLEPGVLEHKFYIAGVGLVSTVDASTGETEELIKIIFDGTSCDDMIEGKLGPDEIYGLAGSDHLNGGTGGDVVKGGRGVDFIDGGKDKDVDWLYGDQGSDHIALRAGDKAFGGSGNDQLRLYDNAGFGLVDGGGQHNGNVGKSLGDVLQFAGHLDLTKAGVSERIAGIETLSMVGSGRDHAALTAQDVLDLGDGRLNPAVRCGDSFGAGDAVRVEGDDGDRLTLTGGKWHEIEDVKNVPDDYDVFARQTAAGTAYVVVNEEVQVQLA